MKIFITGRPGAGKSTLIRELIEYAERNEIPYCGVISPEIRKQGIRVGFKIIALPSMHEEILASINIKGFPRVSKYGVNVEGIDKIVEIVEDDCKNAKIVFVDEIGKMELFSRKFENFILKILNTNKEVVATLQLPLVKRFEHYGKVYFLRREIFDKIKSDILSSLF